MPAATGQADQVAQVQSLKKKCPYFTSLDIATVTGIPLSWVEAALRENPNEPVPVMIPVYRTRLVAG